MKIDGALAQRFYELAVRTSANQIMRNIRIWDLRHMRCQAAYMIGCLLNKSDVEVDNDISDCINKYMEVA